LAADGSGTTENVVAGIDWARTHGADVINLSLGSEVPVVGAVGGDALDAAIRRALAAGIVVVAAAGNSGMPVCEPPGSEVPGALTSICDVKAPSAGTWREIRDMRG
jgi:subtilisin family serine protease